MFRYKLSLAKKASVSVKRSKVTIEEGSMQGAKVPNDRFGLTDEFYHLPSACG